MASSPITSWQIEGRKVEAVTDFIFLGFKISAYWDCCCCCCWVTSVVSDSVQPHRWQPTRLPRPWDSPGKNSGVGCHFLLQCVKVKSESEVAQSCPTLSDPMDRSLPGSSIHGISQARVLEWGAIAFSCIHEIKRPLLLGRKAITNLHAKSFQSHLTLFDPMDCSLPGSSVHGILWAGILESVSMPSSWPRDIPDSGTEHVSLMSPTLAGRFFTTST